MQAPAARPGRVISIDEQRGSVEVIEGEIRESWPLASPEAFEIVSGAWLRAGWDTKYVYGFTWLGRPVIQLPDDLISVQEAIFKVRPDVIVETGIAHGGSLVFFASMCRLLGHGRVIGVDLEIRPHNAEAIRSHPLSNLITTIEGDSADPATVDRVVELMGPGESAFVMLDSNHTKDHVAAELDAYSPLVGVGSYIVAADGIKADVVGAPRTEPDWAWNNPRAAAEEFVRSNPDFKLAPPRPLFNEGTTQSRPSYWSGGWLERVR